ncbi:MAG TPA: hypothetical protein VEL82_07375 [Thermoplasmata archaeon]|nr:hypothetical protein [Thermoplasmata archaeon]
MADPEVDAPVTTPLRRAPVVLVLLALALALGPVGSGAASAHPVAFATTPVRGNVTGPSLISTQSNASYAVNGTGGPAFSANGTLIGNVTWWASTSETNTTGISLSPTTGTITNGIAGTTKLTVGSIAELVTILVMISSRNATLNQTLNVTLRVNVAQPFVLTLFLVAGSNAAVAPFNLTIDLDGAPVGTLAIPRLAAGANYTATFRYPTLGLASGDHTFTASLSDQHGLVTFAGGATSYSVTFYVAGPAPDDTVWYIAGAIAFFGALFIFATRVAARRRPTARK